MILTANSNMNSEEIKAEYTSSLQDLTFNSKPLINVLTMLAEENLAHAQDIVAAIEEHLSKVQTDVKLPVLYLIDCIAKNIGNTYRTLFSQNIVSTFCNVFKIVDEKTRAEMFKLRQTWNDIFPQKKLYAIDVQIHMLDPAWPVTAAPPSNSIHLNPKFLKSNKSDNPTSSSSSKIEVTPSLDTETFSMQQQLIQKQKELIELQQKKLELELLQTQVKLQKQQKAGGAALPATAVRSQNILLKPEVAKQLLPAVTAAKKGAELGIRPQSSAGHKIAPVNSALVAAAATRPTIRDPRLLRGQTDKLLNQQQPPNRTSSTTNNKDSLNLLSNNKLDKNKAFSSSTNNTQTKSPPNRQQSDLKNKKSHQPTNRKSNSSDKSTNLLDSPSKSSKSGDKSDSSSSLKSPTKSPSRYKKKSDRSSDNKKVFKDSKRDRDNNSSSKGHKNESATFKGVKNSTKNRNYMRRNRSSSYSPEMVTNDVDLRMSGPPEKQAKLLLQADKNDETKSGMDVDLRQLPNAVSKKRLSTENIDVSSSTNKKAKNEMFDVLFGHEDTDLRRVLPVAQPDRPPTPPPPIISNSKDSNLDAVRAKLANATGRSKILSKSYRKKRDEEIRPATKSDNMKKIIISSDDEQCIKAGTMSKEQEKQLMNKIIAQIEHQKLKEAQERDKKESNSDQLQVVSDEDLEIIEDRDDRMNYPKSSSWGESTSSRDGGRRGGNYWRGGSKRRHWEPPAQQVRNAAAQSIRPWLEQPNSGTTTTNNPWRPINAAAATPFPSIISSSSYQDDGTRSPEVPNDHLVVDSVNQDDIKTINIDGVPRDIRYYDETAIVFMDWDDPKEISFQNGTRRVVFDDNDVYYLSFNEGYTDVSISGTMHKVRLGAPSREIYIDGKPYECYFGGGPITVDVNGQMIVVKLDGPAPQVKIGQIKRTDLVAGKVNLIIDAKTLVPVFLDAKVQKFVIDSETHTLKFVDALKTVLINDVPFKVEFGGLPKPITVHDKKHFIRFSVLPRGVKPGSVSIKDMEGAQGQDMPSTINNVGATTNNGNLAIIPPLLLPSLIDQSNNGEDSLFHDNVINEPALPIFGRGSSNKSRMAVMEDEERNSNSPHFFQNFMHQNNLDYLSNVMNTSSSVPSANSGGYQVDNSSQSIESCATNNPMPILPPSLNINDLFQKLVATGIVATNNKDPVMTNQQKSHHHQHHQPKKSTQQVLRAATFNKPETLKVRQGGLYDLLYAGMQCSSCGMRFPPEQTVHYSQHLDWHFRQNRKGKKNIRVAASRRWYYSLSDWKNYEEIEDLEEREKNYFDQQQLQTEGAGDDGDEEVEIPSVPADPDVQEALCEVCQDRLDLFFNEEKEEWHLRNAIRVDDRTYHPVCYEDHENQMQQAMDDGNREESSQEEESSCVEKTEEQIPGLEIILDDDDDEEEEAKEENGEVLIAESDESKNIEDKSEENTNDGKDEDDDDVILHEIAPEHIEIDDEKEYLDTVPIKYAIKSDPQVDDGFMDVEEGLINMKNGGQVKIKQEPIDPDDLPPLDETLVEPEEETTQFAPTQPTLLSSMDGNTEMAQNASSAPSQAIGGKIKINISKALPALPAKEPKETISEAAISIDSIIDPSQPLPPGEEPIQLNVKPALRGVELKKMPAVKKGSELTGMCSIM